MKVTGEVSQTRGKENSLHTCLGGDWTGLGPVREWFYCICTMGKFRIQNSVPYPPSLVLGRTVTITSFWLKFFVRRNISQSVSSVAQSCLTLCNPMIRSTPVLPVHHKLPEFTQSHAHRVSGAIQPSHPLSSPSPPVPNPSQHQGLFQRVNSSHEVAKVLEFQLQHQSFQWTPRTDLL